MCSEKNIDGTQNFAMVPKIVAKVVIWPFFWTWKMMKNHHLKTFVREFGYHFGTIMGTVWVPLDTLGIIGVLFWVPLWWIFENQKIDFLRFFTFTSVLWVPNGTQSGTPNFFIVKCEVSAFQNRVERYHTMSRSISNFVWSLVTSGVSTGIRFY